MTAPINNQGFPKFNSRFVDTTSGNIVQPWLQLLITIWNRTGAALGAIVSNVSIVTANGISGTVTNPTTTPAITLNLGDITPSSVITGNITSSAEISGVTIDAGTLNVSGASNLHTVIASGSIGGANLSGNNTGDVTLAGENYATISGQQITFDAINLTSNVTGVLPATNLPIASNSVFGIVEVDGTTITASAGVISASGSVVLPSLANDKIWIGNSSNIATAVSMSGDATIANTGALTFDTVNSNVGSFTATNITVNGKGLITAASNGSAGITLPIIQGIALMRL